MQTYHGDYITTWCDQKTLHHGYRKLHWDTRIQLMDLNGGLLCNGDKVVLKGWAMPYFRSLSVRNSYVVKQSNIKDKAIVWKIYKSNDKKNGEIINLFKDKVCFKSCYGKWLCADINSNPQWHKNVRANRNVALGWESFTAKITLPESNLLYDPEIFNKLNAPKTLSKRIVTVNHLGETIFLRKDLKTKNIYYSVMNPSAGNKKGMFSNYRVLPLNYNILADTPWFEMVSDGMYLYFGGITKQNNLCAQKLILNSKNIIKRVWKLDSVKSYNKTCYSYDSKTPMPPKNT